MPDEDIQRDETAAQDEGRDAGTSTETAASGEPTTEPEAPAESDGAKDQDGDAVEDAPMTEEEMRRRIDEAEQRAKTAEIERKVAESERDRAKADKERADKLVTLAAGTVGNAGSMCIGLAISLADDTHYEMVDQIQGLEDSLVAIQELFDGLLAEVDPEIIGKAMTAQQSVSQIMGGDMGVSTPDL